jgi:hypothetical protein
MYSQEGGTLYSCVSRDMSTHSSLEKDLHNNGLFLEKMAN